MKIEIPVVVKNGNKLIWSEPTVLELTDECIKSKREFAQEYPKREDEEDEDSLIVDWRIDNVRDEYIMKKSSIDGIGVMTYSCGTIGVEIIYSYGTSSIYMKNYNEAVALKDKLTDWLINKDAKYTYVDNKLKEE